MKDNTDFRKMAEENHLDRFQKVSTGLGLSDEIANKIANFIHYEIMTAKKATAEKHEIEGWNKCVEECAIISDEVVCGCPLDIKCCSEKQATRVTKSIRALRKDVK